MDRMGQSVQTNLPLTSHGTGGEQLEAVKHTVPSVALIWPLISTACHLTLCRALNSI